MTLNLISHHQTNTEQIGADLTFGLKAGDLVLLSGDLGAGKTTLARSVIRQLTEDDALEVPSPTYTLCQSYDARIPIHHYDLYRISSMEELDELGWQEQLEDGCVLMEWPQNVFGEYPENSICISLTNTSIDTRNIEIACAPEILERLKRSLDIRTFLTNHGYKNAARRFLTGDASSRAYETIGEQSLVLMNSPAMPDGPPIKDGKPYSQIAHLAEDVSAFVAIANLLKEKGFRSPKILHHDLDAGFLIIENLGSGSIIDNARMPIAERYKEAVGLLSLLHQSSFDQAVSFADNRTHHIPRYDEGAMMIEAELLKDWYIPYEADAQIDTTEFDKIWDDLTKKAQNYPTSLVLRDYHSPNIIWMEGKSTAERIGLIDFQDAMLGPEAYDVASLAQDARVDVSQKLEDELVSHYISLRKGEQKPFDEETFRESYAVMSALRATKILGIFIRLDIRDNKPAYRAHLPRMREYLKRSLNHPVLENYRDWLANVMKL